MRHEGGAFAEPPRYEKEKRPLPVCISLSMYARVVAFSA